MHAHYKFPASFMSTPLALAVSLLAASDVMAQAAPAAVPASAPSQSLETVRITGQAASLRKALDQQTQAQGILNVVHADGIGKLPDANAAEALARLPGVSVERDQGEGRFVRVRGLGADFNAVNINGAITPASEAARRAPGLDLVPSGLIRALEVDKTPAPEHEASSLGGRVSVKTLSAFDLAGRLLSVEVGSNRDQPVGVDRPRAQLTYADRFLGSQTSVAGVARNTLARLWWLAESLEDYDQARLAVKNQDIYVNIFERGFGLVTPAAEAALSRFQQPQVREDDWRDASKWLQQRIPATVIESLDEREISEILDQSLPDSLI